MIWDEVAGVWYCTSNDYPIVLESGSLDDLIERIRAATPELLEGNGLPSEGTLHFGITKTEKLQPSV